MKTPATAILFLLGFFLFAFRAAADPVVAKVRYISADHIYLDTGALAGLQIGMNGNVRRKDSTIAVLEVVYVANHSAACVIVGESATLVEGDEAFFLGGEITPRDEPTSNKPTLHSRLRAVAPADSSSTVNKGPQRVFSGSVGLQWDHTTSQSGSTIKTDFWALPFRFKVEGLGHGWDLKARGTLRHFKRSGLSGDTPAGEWRNRIREVALVKEDRHADWNLAVGRVRSRATSAAGPFDGMMAERRLGNGTFVGVFGGFTPQWGTYAFGTDDHVLGVTMCSRSRKSSGRFMDANLTALGRYRGGEISREYMTWTTSLRQGSQWSLTQAGEVDLNRGWRKDIPGRSSLSLTSLALTGGVKVFKRMRLDLGFDDRELVRTWESRSLPDSLFQDSGRRGWRVGATLRNQRGGMLRLSGSIRSDDNQTGNISSWTGRYIQPRLWGHGLSLNLSLRGFDGPYLKGWAPQGGLSTTKGRQRFSLDTGGYFYQGIGDSGDRRNTWAKLRYSHDLAAGWSSTAEFKHDWGDDIAGNRWWLELRHRF